MTVLEAIQRSTEFLAKKSVDSPRLQSELLLAHLLKLPRMKLYLNFERALTEEEVTSFRELIRRRGQREPLQYITGLTSFCGLEIAVNRSVLIPRPETELLAERGWSFLNQRKTIALDFGTGSGCLAIALTVKSPPARIVGVDNSSSALTLAGRNAASHQVNDRITFVLGDSLAKLTQTTQYDLIISNPPYIPTSEIETLQPEVRDYEPRTALDGGVDGLDYFRRLASEAKPLLNSGGRLMLELGDGQSESIRQILEAENWIVEAVQQDYNQRPRVLVAKRAE